MQTFNFNSIMKVDIHKKEDKKLKIFYGGIFVKKESLVEAGINHPIKLEYYKIINEDEMIKNNKERFGISIIKTDYIENKVNTDEKTIKYLSNDEKRIEELLKIFKENEVTPIGVEDIIKDFSQQIILI